MKKRLSGILTLLLALVVQVTFAQQKQVTGTVTDQEGMPLPGVNVIVKDTNRGTQTDFDGNFVISAASGESIVFSYLGFETAEFIVGDSNIINVSLGEDAAELEEVVVVGYGTSTKQSFTGTAEVVSGEKLQRKNVADVSKALTGEVAGVRVINTSGQPGTEGTIRIRGIGSVNGNRAPLYVVDGVPYTGSINAINPSDIASTTVLKDAAATAIYGARGANGVIVINTRDGKSGQSSVEVETKYGSNFQLLPRYETIKSPERFIELGWEALRNRGANTASVTDAVGYANERIFSASGIDPRYNMWNVATGAELIDPATGLVRSGVSRKYDPENWEDFAFQSSNRSETNLKLSGGSEKSTYYASVGYLKDVGYSINSDFERWSGRLNITHDVKDWLSGSVDMGYTLSETNAGGQSSDSGSVFWFADNIPSIYPLFLRDENGGFVPDPFFGGNQYDYGTGRGFGALTNAVADAHYNVDNSIRHNFNGNGALTATLTEGLTLEGRFGAQYYNNSFDGQNNPFYGSAAQQNGSIFKTKTELFNYNFLQLLRYKKSFGDHSLEAFVAHESNSWERKYLSAYKSNLVIPDGLELNNGVVSSPASSYTLDYTLESYFGQVNYDFADTYFLSGTLRRDGSSRFLNDKWGTFGAVGAAWVLTNEDFMAGQNIFSNLKLKASYGLIGDQAGVGYYPGSDLFNVDNLNDEISLSFDTKGNPDLTWETSKMFQAGIEFDLGRYFEGSVDYYIKNTDDLIFERRVPPSLGYAIITVNDGKLKNTGIEFDFTGHLISNDDFYLDLSVNGEIIDNEIVNMPIDPATQQEKIIDIQGNYGLGAGHSVYDYYMREFAGVDPQTGVSTWSQHYFDANSNGSLDPGEGIASLSEYIYANPDRANSIEETTTTTYANATQKYVGKSAIPDVRGAFNLNFGYKGFELNAQMLYQIGGYSYDFVYARLMHNDVVGGNNWHQDIENRWQQPGDITNVPRLTSGLDTNVSSASTRWLTKADYLALNNVRLGYNVPTGFVENIGLNAVNIWVSGDNLMLLAERDGFNPTISETGTSDWYTYNPLTTVSAGVRVNF